MRSEAEKDGGLRYYFIPMFHEKLKKDGDPFYKRLLGGEAASVASGDQIIFLLYVATVQLYKKKQSR